MKNTNAIACSLALLCAAGMTAAGTSALLPAPAPVSALSVTDGKTVTTEHFVFAVYEDHAALSKCLKVSGMEIPAEISGVPVTEIADQAFEDLSDLETVVIPPNIKRIGDFAFNRCNCLESVTFSEGLTTLGKCAFANCASLKTVHLPDSLTTIGDYVFYCC